MDRFALARELVLRAGDAPGQLELTVSTQGLETQMLQIPTV